MKTILITFIATVNLSFFIITVNAHNMQECVCPDTSVQGNLSDPAVFAVHQLNIVERLWNTPTPILSKDAQALKNVVLEMAHSNNSRYRDVALAITMFSWSTVPQIALKPEICTYAQLINTTVSWETTHNCTTLSESIDSLSSSIGDRGTFVAATAIKAAGCGSIKFTPQSKTCYANGTVYQAKEFWALKGSLYPRDLEKAAMALYHSNDPLDKLFGITTTSSISDSSCLLTGNYNRDIIIDTFNSQLVPEIPKCCCEQYTSARLATVQPILMEAMRAANVAKSAFGCI